MSAGFFPFLFVCKHVVNMRQSTIFLLGRQQILRLEAAPSRHSVSSSPAMTASAMVTDLASLPLKEELRCFGAALQV